MPSIDHLTLFHGIFMPHADDGVLATEMWLYTLLKSRNKNRPSEARRRSRLTDPLRIQILSFGTLETF
jgi:hypothetical protein